MSGSKAPRPSKASNPQGACQEPWEHRAACRGMDPNIFFDVSSAFGPNNNPVDQANRDTAKRICRGCEVIEQCRETHLHEAAGTFGGLDWTERKRLVRARARAALSARNASVKATDERTADGARQQDPVHQRS